MTHIHLLFPPVVLLPHQHYLQHYLQHHLQHLLESAMPLRSDFTQRLEANRGWPVQQVRGARWPTLRWQGFPSIDHALYMGIIHFILYNIFLFY